MAPTNPGFCKNEDCPSSAELVDFQDGETERQRSSEISLHLKTCEFCEAELEFYSTYPMAAEEAASSDVGAIPTPLYQLAEALLRNRQSDGSSLNALLQDKQKLVSEI